MNYPDICPICGDKLVHPTGSKDSPILLLGEFPGWQEIRWRTCFIGPTGDVLKAELSAAGLDYRDCRVTNIWLHKPNKTCLDWNVANVAREMIGKKAVFLMGSDVAKVYLDGAISEYEGLKVKSKLFPSSVKFAVACRNPAWALRRGSTIGGIRLAIRRFAELCSREGLI